VYGGGAVTLYRGEMVERYVAGMRIAQAAVLGGGQAT
jgi:hypothetical protein